MSNDPTQYSEDAATLWCVHLDGPDEVMACRDEAHAKTVAKQVNDFAAGHRDGKTDPMLRATVIPWPWSAASHAEDCARWEKESPPKGN